MLCKKLHHAAFRCKDARATVDFYTEALGLKFSHAMGEDHVPSTGQYSPHIHIFFEMEDASSIAFFEVPNYPGNVKDQDSPDWIQHIAFEVADLETLHTAQQRLQSSGIAVLGPTNHDDFITSIYFHDPSGHRLELTVRTCGTERLKEFEEEAPAVLSLWEQTHDWSRREEIFGARTGCIRDTAPRESRE